MSPFLYFLSMVFFSLILPIHSPLLLCINLILISSLISCLYYIRVSKWVSYSLILIFLGGMMVVFLYVSMISLNDKIMFKTNTLPLIVYLTLLLMATLKTSKPNYWLTSTPEMLMSTCYTFYTLPLILFSISYLLNSLFLIVYFAQSFKGSIMKTW